MEILAKKDELKLVSALVAQMKAAGKLFEAQPAIWMPQVILAAAKRDEGEIVSEGRQIVFKGLPKELADLNGKYLPLKGKGPTIRIAIAKAMSDWTPPADMIEQAKAAGRKAPTPIKKGTTAFRCFS